MFNRENAQQYDRNKPHSPRPERPEQATEPHQNFTVSLPHKGGKQCRLIESRTVETILVEKSSIFFGVNPLPFFAFFVQFHLTTRVSLSHLL